MDKLKHVILIIFLFGFTLYFRSPAQAATVLDPASYEKEPIAAIQLSPNGVEWWPNAEYLILVLTVSGKGEAYFEQEFGPDSIPTFDLLDNDGNKFPDGSCTYELQAIPFMAPKSRDVAVTVNEVGTRGAISALEAENLSEVPLVQSGSFAIFSGKVVTQATIEEDVLKDQVILDDLIVDGSACIGFDCSNGESFGFDTLRLKENNLRIKFQDTSSSAGFPSNDWQITANDSSNGGANKFSIDDIDSGKTPFTIEAGTRANAIYVDDSGRVGLGTSTPAEDLHIWYGDTPTIRLHQSGGGWTPQTWDMAGNEANFFIRDVTNGSELPFRIRPNAPTSSIDIASDGDVGIGTASPTAKLHVKDSGGDASLFVEETSGTGAARKLMHLKNNGGVQFDFENTATSSTWRFINSGNPSTLIITELNQAGAQLTIDKDGDIHAQGDIYSGATQLNVPDYVFESGYPLMSLNELDQFIAENKHLPNIPSKTDVDQEQSLNITQLQMKLLEKIEELTLYTLNQQKVINSQQETIDKLTAQQETIDKLNARLTAIEQAQR